jgi:hypothetical protein
MSPLGSPESLDLLLAALFRGRVNTAGGFFSFREVDVVPRPRTSPYLRSWWRPPPRPRRSRQAPRPVTGTATQICATLAR